MVASHRIFDFIDGKFVVETSGGHSHPHASVKELTSLFDSGPATSLSVKDLPAHWFEAQLLHYGLPPSKVKSTAEMTLLDELNKDTLRVSNKILRLEHMLGKYWYNEDSKEGSASESSGTQRSPQQKVPNLCERLLMIWMLTAAR